jgi:nitrile hydratase
MTVRPQDLGGRRGFGAVPIEQDEPVFHAPWEASVIAGILATIAAGLYNVDQFREGIDDLEPLSYLALGYYRRWLHTLEVNCVKSGVFSDEQLERRIEEIAAGAAPAAAASTAMEKELRELIYFSAPLAQTAATPPVFAAGDPVRGRVLEGARHSRIPVYAQGRQGTILRVLPAFPDPDTNRRGEGERPEHVYSVEFAGRELWPDADERSTIVLDLWESYLEPAAPREGAA